MNLTVLLIEPDIVDAGLMRAALKLLDLHVYPTHDRDAAVSLLSTPQPIHLVLANWTQTGISGLDIATAIHRASRVPIPVVLYSRSVDLEAEEACARNNVAALLMTPISHSELRRRLHSILLDYHPWAFPAKSVVGDLELDREKHVVVRRGKRLHLTPSQFAILEALMSRPGKVLSREELHLAISDGSESSVRSVDVHIQRLKAALAIGGAKPPIKSVRGKGYVLA